jgi:hypothetical protein
VELRDLSAARHRLVPVDLRRHRRRAGARRDDVRPAGSVPHRAVQHIGALLGRSLGYQLGAIIGGGFAPIIATALLAKYQSTVGISVYMAVACIITIISTALLSERKL